MYRFEWQDIKDGKYSKTQVKSSIKIFYVDRGLGLATVNLDHTLSLANRTEVDLKAKVDSEAIWTVLTCMAKCWIVSGDLESDGHAVIAGISKMGNIMSTLKLKLTTNGYKNKDGSYMYGGIFTRHQAYGRGRQGIMLAIERGSYCHLISVVYGRLSRLQSIDSIVPSVLKDKSERVVASVTATGTKGEFIVGGIGWTKRICLKLK